MKMKEKQHRFLRLAGVLLCLAGIFMTSCGGGSGAVQRAELSTLPPLEHAYKADPPQGSVLLALNTQAGDVLNGQLMLRTGSGSPVLATSMVNLDDLDQSSPFGRLCMQQVGSRLAQHGFKIVEVRLGDELRMEKKAGEFMLTRDSMRLLSKSHNAHAVLTGVYSEGQDRVFMSVRVVRLQDSAVLAAYEYYMPKSSDTKRLMGADYAGTDADYIWNRYAQRERAFRAN